MPFVKPSRADGDPPAGFPDRWRRLLTPPLAFLAIAIVYTWPLVRHPTTLLASTEREGDALLNYWILGWDLHTISSRPLALVDGSIFNANIFHPAAGVLTYSDHLIVQALLTAPLFWITGSVALCFNVLFVCSLMASATAMHVFVRATTGSSSAAWVAGIVWGFWPYHVSHVNHLQLQSLYFLPLAFLCVHRLVAGRRRRDAAALGVTAALQAASSVYYGVIGAVGLAVGGVTLLALCGVRRVAVLARRLALAGVVGAVLIAPIVWAYAQTRQSEGFGRNLFEAARHAAVPLSPLIPPHENLLFGRTPLARELDRSVEARQFLGFTVIALSLVGLWRNRGGAARPMAAALAATAIVGYVFALGPDGVRPLYAFAHRWIFGFEAIRAPARFGVLVAFGAAGLAGLGVQALAGQRRWVAAAASAVILLEYANTPIAFTSAPPARTAIGQWLRDAPEPGAVVHLPLVFETGNTPSMVQSLEHLRPIVNGYSGQRPWFFPSLVETLSAFPSPEALLTLKDLDVRFVVAPSRLVTPPAALVERVVLDGGTIYELRWSPETEAALSAASAPAPPPPGPAPFEIGERLTFRITVTSGLAVGLGLQAGEATLAVEQAAAEGEAYRFRAEVVTSPWVSQFFEAHDEFVTTATREIAPLVHERRIREGKRSLDLRAVFDHAQHVVRVREDRVVRVPVGARDPATVFYYLRTFPWAVGDRIAAPVTDLGSSFTLDVRAAAVETIESLSGPLETIRLEPTIIQRAPRRAPPRITVWLTRDAARTPVRVDIAAGFGAVRADLAPMTQRER